MNVIRRDEARNHRPDRDEETDLQIIIFSVANCFFRTQIVLTHVAVIRSFKALMAIAKSTLPPVSR
ncbi:MAG TPA: hypothetical protein VKM55_10330 [Candidatus Lokiarchaeia archaeon]|nr:hypothetical protein [Candidatus Lokiarchaeia archaeon]